MANFWNRGLFKETVTDETRLRIHVTDRDTKSRFLIGLRKILSVLLGVGLTKAAKGISDVYLGAVAKLAISQTTAVITTDGKTRVQVLASGETILNLDDPPSRIHLPLTAPHGLIANEFLKAGASNGFVELSLVVERL